VNLLEEKMSVMTILCVEDQPDNMATLVCMLVGIGYEVVPVSSGRQAIEAFRNESIDGVLVEYNLPSAASGELRAQLKAIRPDVPVLLFDGISSQTPLMVRFFDAYLREMDWVGEMGDLEA
jgi:CheY-like chemotaxis protein